MEEIKKLLELIENDSMFADEIMPLMKDANEPAIIAAAKKKGLEITEADWKAFTLWQDSLPVSNESAQPLNEEELENVAGGSMRTKKSYCWFKAASEPEFRNGEMRRRCKALSCRSLKIDPPAVIECWCHETRACADGWHSNACYTIPS